MPAEERALGSGTLDRNEIWGQHRVDAQVSTPVPRSGRGCWRCDRGQCAGASTAQTNNVAGFRYDKVTGSRDYNTNTFKAGPTNPFGSFSTGAHQMSLYAIYTPG